MSLLHDDLSEISLFGNQNYLFKNTVPSVCTEKQPHLGTEDLIFLVLQPNHPESSHRYRNGAIQSRIREPDIKESRNQGIKGYHLLIILGKMRRKRRRCDMDEHKCKERPFLSCDNMTRKNYEMNKLKGKRKQQTRVKCKGAPPLQQENYPKSIYNTLYLVRGVHCGKCKDQVVMCKNTITQNNASSYEQMISTILILMKFRPKIIYHMT